MEDLTISEKRILILRSIIQVWLKEYIHDYSGSLREVGEVNIIIKYNGKIFNAFNDIRATISEEDFILTYTLKGPGNRKMPSHIMLKLYIPETSDLDAILGLLRIKNKLFKV